MGKRGQKIYPRRNGDLRAMLLDRLPSRAEGQCWEYGGTCNPDGYGKLHVGGRRYVGAHRIAYQQFIGPIPTGLVVRHTCDNPPCCNPSHLTLGTVADNAKDSVERGRNPQARKTHCLNGHEFNEKNTYHLPDGGRNCRPCGLKRWRANAA